ncbi:MAG: redoxin domain-containing protein [Planctomycetes bacterium]|nr:redoxin domain-containing protein [Planctomycetota bacterium]
MRSAQRLLLGLVLLAGSSLPEALATAAAQDPGPPAQGRPSGRSAKKKPDAKDLSPEFVQLNNAWVGALNDYSTALLTYDRANAGLPLERRDPKGTPVHPAPAWWKRFEELGKAGDPDALLWMVQQAGNAFPESERCTAAAASALDELLRTHPEHRTVEDALQALRPLFDRFGRERFLALVKHAHDAAKDSQAQACALLLEAWALADRSSESSPEIQRQVQGLYDEILLVHPGTRTAREVAGRVHAKLESEFIVAELAWVDAVRELQRAGKDPSQWPPQPMHAWNQKYLPVAAAGGPQAREFVNRIYPAYQQAEGNGMGFGLAWLQQWLMSRAPGDVTTWARARLGLVEILARQYHGQPLVTSVMVDLTKSAVPYPVEWLEPALQPAIDDGSAPKAQALALLARAMVHTAHNRWADWEAARADLERLLREHPTEECAAHAQALLSSLLNVWPGHAAPDFRGTDQEGLAFKLEEYKGFLCLIDFGDSVHGMQPEEIEQRRGLIQSFAGRPFRLIGGVLDTHTQRSFRERLAALGIDWRCALLGSRASDVAGMWSVQVTPAVFVVDAEGVIRGRNLPWAEQQALIGKLVAQVEAKRAPR